MLTRVRANAGERERMEKAIAERIVSEDGIAAVSEVIGGKLAFLRGLAQSLRATGHHRASSAGMMMTIRCARRAASRWRR